FAAPLSGWLPARRLHAFDLDRIAAAYDRLLDREAVIKALSAQKDRERHPHKEQPYGRRHAQVLRMAEPPDVGRDDEYLGLPQEHLGAEQPGMDADAAEKRAGRKIGHAKQRPEQEQAEEKPGLVGREPFQRIGEVVRGGEDEGRKDD